MSPVGSGDQSSAPQFPICRWDELLIEVLVQVFRAGWLQAATRNSARLIRAGAVLKSGRCKRRHLAHPFDASPELRAP